mmetsp:Transcript_9572/g.29602  ORF Transcript_9572/g.29602 Transcript_9572/m.29602 type:complete len:492 (+) Transcript_9572:61-1536(+)
MSSLSILDTGSDERPVCKYGDKCFRRHPQHFLDFSHPDRSARPPPPATSLRPAPTASSSGRDRGPTSRCKFGCGRLVKRDRRRVYNTCCRQCALCQGAGEHDEQCAGGRAVRNHAASSSAHATSKGSAEAEAEALMAIDHALELRRSGKELEAAGRVSEARVLFADSTEKLQSARARVPPDGKLAQLLDSILAAIHQSEGATSSADAYNNVPEETSLGSLEEEVDAELDRLVSELERTLSELMSRRSAVGGSALAALCKFGCGRTANPGRLGDRPFDTCCRACGRCRGAGSHDAGCTGGPGATTDALVPASTELAQSSEALEPYTGKCDGGGAESRSCGSAQEALRLLGLSDEWPTELTMREIRRRYMRECLATHPDKGPPEEQEERTRRFQELSTAYAKLEVAMAVLERDSASAAGGGAPPASDVRPGQHAGEESSSSSLLPLRASAPGLPGQADRCLPAMDEESFAPASGGSFLGGVFGCLQVVKAEPS